MHEVAVLPASVLSRITAGAWCLFINELLPAEHGLQLFVVPVPAVPYVVQALVLVPSFISISTRVFIIYGHLSRGAFYAIATIE